MNKQPVININYEKINQNILTHLLIYGEGFLEKFQVREVKEGKEILIQELKILLKDAILDRNFESVVFDDDVIYNSAIFACYNLKINKAIVYLGDKKEFLKRILDTLN